MTRNLTCVVRPGNRPVDPSHCSQVIYWVSCQQLICQNSPAFPLSILPVLTLFGCFVSDPIDCPELCGEGLMDKKSNKIRKIKNQITQFWLSRTRRGWWNERWPRCPRPPLAMSGASPPFFCYVKCLSSSCKTIKSCEKFKKVNNNELAVATMTVLCQAGHNGVLAPGEENHHHHYNQHHTSLTFSMFIKWIKNTIVSAKPVFRWLHSVFKLEAGVLFRQPSHHMGFVPRRRLLLITRSQFSWTN